MAPGFTVAKMTEGLEIQPRQTCSNPGQAGVSIEALAPVTTGTRAATAFADMAAVARVLGLLVMAVIPGGLLFLAAFVLGRAVAEGVRRGEGTTGRRFAKAVADVRLRDVWTSAKQTL